MRESRIRLLVLYANYTDQMSYFDDWADALREYRRLRHHPGRYHSIRCPDEGQSSPRRSRCGCAVAFDQWGQHIPPPAIGLGACRNAGFHSSASWVTNSTCRASRLLRSDECSNRSALNGSQPSCSKRPVDICLAISSRAAWYQYLMRSIHRCSSRKATSLAGRSILARV